MAEEKPRVCGAKLGEPFKMRECGRRIVYLDAAQAKSCGKGQHSGWYHAGPNGKHHAVPKHEI